MTTTIIPTVGRIVLVPIRTYRPGPDGCITGPVEIWPGIVVRVFERTDGEMPLINVCVFTDGSNNNAVSEWVTSLRYSQDDHRVGTWHWMPYQLQTAPVA